MDDKYIENFLKIIRTSTTPPTLAPYMAQKKLKTLCYWVNRCNHLNESIDANEFTPKALITFTQLLSLDKQDESASQVKLPAELKASSKWKPFKEGVIAYFNSIHTRSQIPLAYVIRENENPDPYTICEFEQQRLIAVTPLQGIESSEDNGKIFDYFNVLDSKWASMDLDVEL